MLVLNVMGSDVEVIKEALDGLAEASRMQLKEELEPEVEIATENTIVRCERIKDWYIGNNWMRKGELVERCLSFFWEMYKDFDGFDDTMTELMDDMGIDEEELKDLFNELGYTEDEE